MDLQQIILTSKRKIESIEKTISREQERLGREQETLIKLNDLAGKTSYTMDEINFLINCNYNF